MSGSDAGKVKKTPTLYNTVGDSRRINVKEDDMKILKAMMLVIVLLIVPGYALSANSGYMRVSLIEGDVQIKTPDSEEWGFASVNTPLAEGDQLWVPQGGRVELQLNTGTYIRLDESSALQILSMDEDSSQFYLSQGYAYIFYDAPVSGGVIQIDTPDASTRAFDRAVFRIDMSEQYTDVAVYKGYVETENNVGKTVIEAGQMISLGENTDGEVSPMGPPDEWEKWNKKRNDRVYAGSDAGSRYLPFELRPYSTDFDSYGKWVRVSGYGNVWTPTVAVDAGWSPYRNGRWIWRGGDYIWVASEPWGWAPYHYGRWSFGVNIGWFWVPPVDNEVYWSPGYVGWVRTPDYVAWVPLAPGEIYYGRGNYGRHSVNIINVNITRVNITNVYKNADISNGVTVVNRNTFNTGRPTIADVDKNIIRNKIFVKNNFSVGTPDIKPSKESYFASTRQIQPAKLPPQPVRDMQVKELKHSRPLIKDRDKSVLNPGVKPNSLPVNTVVATPRTPGKGKFMIQQVKPVERAKSSGPVIGPTGRGEKEQVKPEERVKPGGPVVGPTGRGEKEQVKPEERVKPSSPVVGPTGRGEKQQVQPEKVVKPSSPVVGPTDRGEKPQVKPEEKVTPTAPIWRPTGRGEKQQIEPVERVKPSSPVVSPPDRGEKQQVKPEERATSTAPKGRPTGRGEKEQVKPDERAKPGGPVVGPPGRGEKQQVKPAESVKPGGPVVNPTDSGEKQQVEPEEKRKPVVPERGDSPRGERQNVRQDKKGKHEVPE